MAAELRRRQVTKAKIAEERLAGRDSLATYVRGAWTVLEPSTPYLHNWHIDCICEHLEAVTAGQLTRLIVNVPPRYMKSTLITTCWPTWEWGPKNLPFLKYLFSSYSSEISTKHSLDRRAILKSAWFQDRWGRTFSLVDDNDRKTEFANTARGVMTTTSTGAASTGKGGDRLVVDDPSNPRQALSDAEREKANTHFDQTLYTRLDDKQKGAIVVVMQRLHTKDLVGHLLDEKKEQGWTHLNFPAIAEKRTVISLPKTGREVVREEGDILWPERETAETVAKTKTTMGAYAFGGQYQQRPAPLEGGVIERTWFKRFAKAPERFDELILSGDPAFKGYDTSSRVALQVWGRIGPNKYLLDRICKRMGFTETLTAIGTLHARWSEEPRKLQATLIEDKANGPAIMEVIKVKVAGVIGIEPDGDKTARILAQSPQIEAGNVWLPSEPWADEIVEILSTVPNNDEWDDVDAMSQALRYLNRHAKRPMNFELPDLSGASNWLSSQTESG